MKFHKITGIINRNLKPSLSPKTNQIENI